MPSSASGTVTLGMMVAHRWRRNRKITITTSAMVRDKVNSTSSTEARMVWVRSDMTWTLTAGGIAASSCGRVFWILSTVSMTFAPGCLKTISSTPGLSFCQAASLAFSGPAMAWPMSRTRTGEPLR